MDSAQPYNNPIQNRYLILLIVITLLLAGVRNFVAEPLLVSGYSMYPNYDDGDYILSHKMQKQISNIKRGDVIVFHNPQKHDQIFIKRVIGIPGESVAIHEGRVYIDNEPLEEPYLLSRTYTPGGSLLKEGKSVAVTPEQYFVMGDNRESSSDSRDWGLVKKDAIIGFAGSKYWPIVKSREYESQRVLKY